MGEQPGIENVQKPGRGEFKCFNCRQVHPFKEGDWYPWADIEVHLCKSCESVTRKKPERTGRSKAGRSR
jgi:hypothetical protein